VVETGTNAKLNEFSAAMGLTLLEDWDSLIEHNWQQYDHYRSALANLPGVRLAEPDPREKSNHQYLPLEIDPGRAGLTRDDLHAVLAAENIVARRYFYPGCHRAVPYLSMSSNGQPGLPVTERLVERVLCLPTGAAVVAEEVAQVCSIIRLALSDPAPVRRRLAALAGQVVAPARLMSGLEPAPAEV
jgi:dTDP-4-amino-4,6-dideoxygalactose transaminase